MNSVFFPLLAAVLVAAAAPAYAQEITFGERADQKSMQVDIGDDARLYVTHVIAASETPRQLDFVAGTVTGITVTDGEGGEQIPVVIGDNSGVLVAPSETDTTVQYHVDDAIELRGDYWTLEFLYLESTVFMMPEGVGLFYVNNGALDLEGDRGFVCHGCQMVIEYSFDEPKITHNVRWQEHEFDVHTISLAEISNFAFDQPSKSIAFDVSGENRFVSVIIPLELLWEPYAVFLDEERIPVGITNSNATHVWLTMRPHVSGQMTIIGTTVVPEFPIVPLAAGVMMVLGIPFLRRFTPR